jgi:predicted adenylyl cyclase CyaB
MEINEEREFTVSNGALIEEMLKFLGLHKAMQKEKKGWAWTIHSPVEGQVPITAELSMVTGLGWFLEIEIIASDSKNQTIEENRKRLFSLLEQLEIPAEQIEPRPYSMLLQRPGL